MSNSSILIVLIALFVWDVLLLIGYDVSNNTTWRQVAKRQGKIRRRAGIILMVVPAMIYLTWMAVWYTFFSAIKHFKKCW